MAIDLNTAAVHVLAQLPGVGPYEAYDLVLWRPYLSWAEVAEVPGMDESKVQLIRAAGAILSHPRLRRSAWCPRLPGFP